MRSTTTYFEQQIKIEKRKTSFNAQTLHTLGTASILGYHHIFQRITITFTVS